MSDEQDITVIPNPAGESEADRKRIRQSNDHDQDMERQGENSAHNRGYDEAADGGTLRPKIERIVEE